MPLNPTALSPYRAHVEKWRNCERCKLCTQRSQVVFARGSIPADVLIVGEAPGQSEDVLGQPFVGPAGKLLDRIVADALADFQEAIRTCFYNLVGCFPREVKLSGGARSHEPPEEAVVACGKRLQEFIGVCKPRLLVAVGKLSETWLEQGYKHSIPLPPDLKQTTIVHPAAILRTPTAQQGLAIQKAVVILSQAIEEVLHAGDSKQTASVLATPVASSAKRSAAGIPF